ncbi:hypothetical protein DFH09DRAFT_1076300 [Mycena vulgaris]|nr:hypothetical protein DFH09DRAFT_1076300 [Mycena vulgaris]
MSSTSVQQPPGPSGTSSAGAGPARPRTGSKRTRDQESPPPSPPSSNKRRRPRGPMPPSATKKRQNQHHLRLADIKPKNKRLKVRNWHVFLCPFTHDMTTECIRAAYEADVVPELPTLDCISAFETGLYVLADDLDSLTASLKTGYSNIVNGAITAVKGVRTLASRTNSIITKNVLAIDEHFLHVIYSGILTARLLTWRPDILSNFGSIPDLTNLSNMQLLEKFYRNYIFSYIYTLAMKEIKATGSVQMSITNTNTYKHHTNLVEKRTAYLCAEGYRTHIIKLASEPKCHSDDEPGFNANGNPIYIIHEKSGRNPSITTFRNVDAQCEKIKLATKKPGQLIHERHRVAFLNVPESAVSQHFPTDISLDWFEPHYFNTLPATLRARYADIDIALPLEEDWYQLEHKTMKKNVFMKKYGKKVKACSQLPTPEELEQMKKVGNSDYNSSSDKENDEEEEGSSDTNTGATDGNGNANTGTTDANGNANMGTTNANGSMNTTGSSSNVNVTGSSGNTSTTGANSNVTVTSSNQGDEDMEDV